MTQAERAKAAVQKAIDKGGTDAAIEDAIAEVAAIVGADPEAMRDFVVVAVGDGQGDLLDPGTENDPADVQE